MGKFNDCAVLKNIELSHRDTQKGERMYNKQMCVCIHTHTQYMLTETCTKYINLTNIKVL